MSEGITCYERDETLCEDGMCLRTGCRLRNERLAMTDTAEARLREHCIRICLEEAAEWDSDDVQTLKNYAGHCANRIAEETALSPPSGGDEAKKSEGGEPDVERTQRRLAVSDDGLGPMQAIPREPPSGPSEPSPPADRREIDPNVDAFIRIAKGEIVKSSCGAFVVERWNNRIMLTQATADAILAALDGGR